MRAYVRARGICPRRKSRLWPLVASQWRTTVVTCPWPWTTHPSRALAACSRSLPRGVSLPVPIGACRGNLSRLDLSRVSLASRITTNRSRRELAQNVQDVSVDRYSDFQPLL